MRRKNARRRSSRFMRKSERKTPESERNMSDNLLFAGMCIKMVLMIREKGVGEWLRRYLFRKNLTRRKFTGTQMQNIGMGAHFSLTPTQMKKLSVASCNT